MPRTTPPRPVDIEAVFPELGSHRRGCTRLHPRPGNPNATDNSIGGPLLWPAGEAWPACQEPHPRDRGRSVDDIHEWRRILAEAWRRSPGSGPTPEELQRLSVLEQEHHVPGITDTHPVPLLPLAQFFARDVPGLAGPDGADVLQVLWCPFSAHGDLATPGIHLRWRNSSKVGELLAEPPLPAVIGDDEYVPEPCVLHPEPVTEHEYIGLLDAGLQERIYGWEDGQAEADEFEGHEPPRYQTDLSTAPGWKVGGFATWETSGPYQVVCTCGSPMCPLLTIASTEWEDETISWVPVEDRHLAEEFEANTPTRVTVGRGGSLTIFTCPTDPRHPHQVTLQ
nr:hypothetical protein [Streptomyces roseochromogenus]